MEQSTYCPNCQQALYDPEGGASMCCADAARRWRCTSCEQVIEGFALPYRRCPDCGGELDVVDAPRSEEDAALEGIRKAFEIELGGQAFYRRAARETGDAAMRRLFEGLADMESGHMETLARRYHVPIPQVRSLADLNTAAVFGGTVNRPEDPENLFRIAIALENRAAEYFSERAAWAEEGSAEERLYRELAAEEQEHASLLAAEHELWRAGKAGASGER